MFKNIENLKINDIHRGISRKNASILCLKNNSFILRLSGRVKYTFDNYSIDISAGELLFLPKGSRYDFSFDADTISEYISIRFDADITNAAPFSCSLERFQNTEDFTNNLPDLWKLGGQCEHYKCYAVFYSLLAYIENLENLTYADKKKFHIISPAILYLKSHIYDCNLKSETLHELCGISGTYFRKIFQSNYGTSPQKYISGKRLSRAKALIDNGDYDSISEIAVSVGYSDPLYFSRAFKRVYGISPTQYAKT